MASDAAKSTQHVIDKGKGPALDAEALAVSDIELQSPDICVICLDRISEKAVALPCNHDQFDFPCLGTWIQQSRICPLCKAEVKAIKYQDKKEQIGCRIFHLPALEIPKRRTVHDINQRRARAQGYRPYDRNSGRRRPQTVWGEQLDTRQKEDRALDLRREIYRKKMYSAYVGTNRISRYRNISPESFSTNPGLTNRAKMFIRRELQVFDFLNPSTTPSNFRGDRRASNAEFLLEYITGILKSIDLKGSGGQAQELLKDFLGQEHAKLFLHELEAWLRSPYERLADWDKHVQYSNIVEVGESSRR